METLCLGQVISDYLRAEQKYIYAFLPFSDEICLSLIIENYFGEYILGSHLLTKPILR